MTAGPLPVATQHGTRSAYVTGCRCDQCRAANRDYQRVYMLNREPEIPPEAHGTIRGYDYHRCRCDQCRTARREYMRVFRARHSKTTKDPA